MVERTGARLASSAPRSIHLFHWRTCLRTAELTAMLALVTPLVVDRRLALKDLTKVGVEKLEW